MSVLDGLAGYLAVLGHGTWSPEQSYTPQQTGIVVGELPPMPDTVIGLSTYPGTDSDSGLPFDAPNVAIRVRGTPHSGNTTRDAAQAIYNDLLGTGHTMLPNGVLVVNIICLQGGPIDAGVDANGRPEFTVNASVDHYNPTTNRS